eukprot:scaffold51358_cov34-Prasinocladus_malaysianus.AAC.6
MLADALRQHIGQKHGVREGLVGSLGLERGHGVGGVANQRNASRLGVQQLAVVDGVAGHAIQRGLEQHFRDGVVPACAPPHNLRLERNWVLAKAARFCLPAGERQLPHCRGGGEGHSVDARASVDGLKHAALGQRNVHDLAVDNAEHDDEATEVKPVAREGELPPHRRENSIAAH